MELSQGSESGLGREKIYSTKRAKEQSFLVVTNMSNGGPFPVSFVNHLGRVMNSEHLTKGDQRLQACFFSIIIGKGEKAKHVVPCHQSNHRLGEV
jgi:hypothetical protein